MTLSIVFRSLANHLIFSISKSCFEAAYGLYLLVLFHVFTCGQVIRLRGASQDLEPLLSLLLVLMMIKWTRYYQLQ